MFATWATTNADLERLRGLRNLRLLPPSEDIDQVLAQTRVLLVPSLWGEAFGLIVVEAMLRGIPVLASDIGGLSEAKLGVDYLLPVRPIQDYSPSRDERGLPTPVVPQQDVAPWLEALDRVISDRGHYRHLSDASRVAALDYVSALTIAPCEDFLHRLATKHSAGAPQAPQANGVSLRSSLSRDRLELLDVLLEERQQ